MDLIQNNITPADGEQSVRTYCCTYYKSKMLGIETNGYLGVTNKRVIFQALSTSNAGNSVIQSEVPVADVSGISSYKGIYFSILHLLGALLLTSVFASITSALLGLIAFTIESFTAFQVIGWLVAIGALVGTFLVPVKSIWRPVLAGVSMASFIVLGGGNIGFSFFGGIDVSGSWQFILAALVLIYVLVCAFWYARRPTFSLEVNSKGGASTPINIASSTGIGLLSISAEKSLNAEPAQDADIMLKELGALILDIQMLGDYGITKWTRQ